MKKNLLWIVIALGFLVLAGLWFARQGDDQVVQAPAVTPVELPPREVLLYFADPVGQFLVSEAREIPGCEEDEDCIAAVFAALAAGPETHLLPVVPAETRVLGVELVDDLALVDFSRQLTDRHPGGSLTELLSVYSLVNSLAVNFPYLRQMQFLVEGQELETLKGHISVKRPIKADFSYSEPPAKGLKKETKE